MNPTIASIAAMAWTMNSIPTAAPLLQQPCLSSQPLFVPQTAFLTGPSGMITTAQMGFDIGSPIFLGPSSGPITLMGPGSIEFREQHISQNIGGIQMPQFPLSSIEDYDLGLNPSVFDVDEQGNSIFVSDDTWSEYPQDTSSAFHNSSSRSKISTEDVHLGSGSFSIFSQDDTDLWLDIDSNESEKHEQKPSVESGDESNKASMPIQHKDQSRRDSSKQQETHIKLNKKTDKHRLPHLPLTTIIKTALSVMFFTLAFNHV